MSGYTTAVTDRTQSDIDSLTSKAYMNVADWTRIYRNSQLASSLAEIELSTAIAFVQISDPTTSTIPTIGDVNNLTGNVEALRSAVSGVGITGTTTAIDHAYTAGNAEPIFDYEDVNLWESTIDAIWVYYGGSAYDVCPTLSVSIVISSGSTNIYIDCLDMDTHNVEIQGTGAIAII